MAPPGKKMQKANKKATKGKGKIWKRGQSASYNPESNKHRQAAKKKAVFGNPGEGNLTENMLLQHNRMITDDRRDDEGMSIGGETAMTAFTNCTLPTFDRLLKNWNNSSFLHKEMVAVLAAVTEVLKTNGGKETETEYFAALMTTLDVVGTDEEITAVVSLLAMVVKRLNESVLKVNCKTTCDTYVKLLLKYMNSDHCALLRNLLSVMCTFWKVKIEWSDSSDDLNIILEFTTHHKPKVRRMAHHLIRTILVHHIPMSLSVHPASIHVANYCMEKLENNAGTASDSRNVFYILSLLEEVIGVFPKLSIKKSCETIFKVMTLSSAMVTLSCFKSLQGLFNSNPKPENLPLDLNARIVMALYDFQPNVKDSQALISWLKLMETSLLNLLSLDEKLFISHLPKFYAIAVKFWLSDKDDVAIAIESALTAILHKGINANSEVFQQLLFQDPVNNHIHKMFRSVEDALSYQYHAAWKQVLNVIGKFFEVIGKHSYTVMMKCLQSLADLHDSYQFSCIYEVEKAIGFAVQKMGPRIVLKAIPLQFDGEKDRPDFPRSWMLPLLRDNIRNTELDFFVKYFLTLAVKMRNKSLVLQQEGKVVESKLYNVICSQIWSLLPGFCTEPTDLKQCFKEVARTLGMILKEDPSLRITVLSSLRLLINKNLENDENRKEIAMFAKNYLPILFNLYTTEPKEKEQEKMRLAIYETCKVYLQIADKELCAVFFDKAMEKMSASESGIFMQHALIDLCKALISRISVEKMNILYEYCKPLLQHSNRTVQKKAYSVLKEICSSESELCRSFVTTHLEDLRLLLSGSMTGLTPSTRALRLTCLQHIVSQLTDADKKSIKEIIPEAVLCTKENSVKARTAAFNLLVEIGETMKKLFPDDIRGALKEYMSLLLAGLGGSPHLMSATVLAIGRVMYEFKNQLDSEIIHLLIENMCLLVTSKSREVVVSALSFIKILFATVDTDALAQHVEFMIKSLTNIADDNQRHFRFKAKEIFTRLIRKFGFEMVSKMMPENYKKQMTNIRKTEARKKRKRDTVESDESESEMPVFTKQTNDFEDILADSDDDLPGEGSTKHFKGDRRKGKKSTVIEETGENDIVDFLDPAINHRLLSLQKHCKKTVKKSKADSFPISEDGRLIIEDDDYTKSISTKAKDERTEVLMELGASTKKKRKFIDSEDEDEEFHFGAQEVKKGIYRMKTPNPKKRRPGEEFKAKKAGGDVKKGNVQPYAYLPFDRQVLNKRKQGKLKGQYKNLVTAAKRGATVGLKRKSRDAGRKKKHQH